MFLKYLDIFGFKSFADKTHFEFADGITALLGPNGCGKSNVVDAVKWVLGEQTAKTMRAEKMEDIIFNGTEKRAALNVAEVILTISNEQNLLPLDVSEITIKRRLYRSGESEYFINNVPSKLKDVRELFWDTGVGKAAYSVMEQGKVDQILSSKPEDRRYLFEEAAGITKFKAKKAEAERKLEKTEENMRQIEGILGEVKRSYDTLKVQADKTTKYRTLKENVFNYELDIQLLRLRNFTRNKDSLDSDLQKTQELRTKINEEINAINSMLAENMDEVNSMQNSINEMNNTIKNLFIEKNEKEKLLKVLKERQSEKKIKISSLENRKVMVEEKITDLQDDIDEQNSVVCDYKKRLQEVKKNIESFTETIETAENRITDNDLAVKQFENDIVEYEKNQIDFEKQLEAITEDIVKELDSKLKEAGYSSQLRKKTYEEVDSVLAKMHALVTGRKNIFSDFAVLNKHSEDDTKKFADNAVSAFKELEDLVNQIDVSVKAWIKATPDFIDEFLSPEGIITKKRLIDQKIQETKDLILQKRNSISELRAENVNLIDKINEYKKTLEDARVNKVQMESYINGAEGQISILKRELVGKQSEFNEIEGEIYEENKMQQEIAQQVVESEGDIASIERKGISLAKQAEALDRDCKNRSSDVSLKQDELKEKNKEAAKIQLQLEKILRESSTAEIEIRNIKENFRETHSRDLMEFEERMFQITEQPVDLREKLSAAKNELRDLGSVNLGAPEEFAEAKERYEFLTTQLEDLKKARDDLRRITEEIRAEATELFLQTYNTIKKNFHNMFRKVFGGGRAELRLMDPQCVLESGIDILAQPPGKKLENIALRSGGEKTMTAIALLFATYMVRPSPFCLLDEIDAPLDEHNVVRFVRILRDFANVSQFIVITHNKKTATVASTLLGITMKESGITSAVTIKLENETGTVNLINDQEEEFVEEDVPPEENVYIPPHPPKRKNEANVNND